MLKQYSDFFRMHQTLAWNHLPYKRSAYLCQGKYYRMQALHTENISKCKAFVIITTTKQTMEDNDQGNCEVISHSTASFCKTKHILKTVTGCHGYLSPFSKEALSKWLDSCGKDPYCSVTQTLV